MTATQPKMLRAKDLAKMFSIGQTSVWAYAKAGHLTPKKITKGLTLFSVKEAESFFNGEATSNKGVRK